MIIKGNGKIKEKKLDIIFSKFIRARDKKCVKCGTIKNLQCAHIFSRTARCVRWYQDNAITLCYKCHFFWAHHNPIEFTEFVQKHLGGERYEKLKRLHNDTAKFSNAWKWAQYHFYETLLEKENV